MYLGKFLKSTFVLFYIFANKFVDALGEVEVELLRYLKGAGSVHDKCVFAPFRSGSNQICEPIFDWNRVGKLYDRCGPALNGV